MSEAEKFVGATAPNPAVGAAALDRQGNVVRVAAHERAGAEHAEAKLLRLLQESGEIDQIETLVVTLEPCAHFGKTPPCTEAILKYPQIKNVYFLVKDLNPKVQGGGEALLRKKGLQVERFTDPTITSRAERLVAPFFQSVTLGIPWIVVKQALDEKGSMIPPQGQKTFTSPESLKYAHELRKQSDAIITGSGTVLADQPLFTVRHVTDHPGKVRPVVVLDRRGRLGAPSKDYLSILKDLSKQGVNQVLVEAGPTLTQTVISSGIWNENVVIRKAVVSGQKDNIEVKTNPCFQESLSANPKL